MREEPIYKPNDSALGGFGQKYRKSFWEYVYENLRFSQIDEVSEIKSEFENDYKELLIKTKKREEILAPEFNNKMMVEFVQPDEDFGRKDTFNILEYALDAFCGICIGIFDYERMDFEEVVETLVPTQKSATKTSLRIMNRGSLVYFCHSEDLYDAVLDNIGISPYLLLPSSVLANNFKVARLAENKAKTLNQQNSKDSWAKPFSISETRKVYQTAKDELEKKLNDEIVSNVFQYPAEQEVFERGMDQRGINTMIEEIKSQKNSIQSKIDKYSNWENELFHLKLNLIAAFLAFVALKEMLSFNLSGNNNVSDDISTKFLEQVLTNPFSYLTLIVILSFIGIYYYRKKKLIENEPAQHINDEQNQNIT